MHLLHRTTIFLIVFLLVAEKCVAKNEVNFVKLINCPKYKNLTAIFQKIVFKRNKTGKSVSIKLNLLIKKELKRMMVMVTLMKCDNSGNLDSCEYYMKDFKVKNACDIMGKNNQMWTAALYNSNFPKSCPVPVGTYKLNDSKLDSDMQLTLLPIPIALWKIHFVTYDSGNDNVMVGCVDLDLEVYTARRNS